MAFWQRTPNSPVVLGTQNSFAAGAFPGQEDIPLTGCEDIVDGLLQDDGSIMRRGGTVYKSNAVAGEELIGVWDGYLAPGRRTIAQSSVSLRGLSTSDDATPVTIGAAGTVESRPVSIANMLVFASAPGNQAQLHVVGGSLTAATSLTGTLTLTQGSKSVTGVGTTFTTHPPGLLVWDPAATHRLAPIRSVESDTSLTLADEWPYPTAAGITNAMETVRTVTTTHLRSGSAEPAVYLAVAGGKLWTAQGDRVWQSDFVSDSGGVARPAPFTFDPTDFHALPAGALVVGLEPYRDGLLVFTTAGVYSISNVAYDLTDDFGNPQQRIDPVNNDVLLWGERGVVTWRNAVVAPAVDGLYLFSEGPQLITGGAERLYRQYVKAGYRLGRAQVFRGHYLLPILPVSGTTDPIDVLVWRVDRIDPRAGGAPFTRIGGHAGKTRAFAVRGSDPSRSPVLLGVSAQRVVDLSNMFEPAAAYKNDADGTTHQLKVTTRSYALTESIGAVWERIRARFELDDAATDNPTISAEYSTGRPGGTFSSASALDAQQEGDVVYRWQVGKRSQQIRFRLTQSNATSKCVLRAVEVFARPSGRP